MRNDPAMKPDHPFRRLASARIAGMVLVEFAALVALGVALMPALIGLVAGNCRCP